MNIKIKQVTIRAPINIALIKYWGKLHEGFNIPLNSSFSLTLDKTDMYSETTVYLNGNCPDSFNLHDAKGDLIENALPKNFETLKDYFTNYAKEKYDLGKFYVKVDSKNSFPTKAGLASSASGLSCIALCFCRLFDYFEENEEELKKDVFENIKDWFLNKNEKKIVRVLSIVLLLRIISGSSCRSTYLFSVLQIGPDLLTSDSLDFNENSSNTHTDGENSAKVIKDLLFLSGWKYQNSLKEAGAELDKYFTNKLTVKNDPNLLYRRYNYLFSAPTDWSEISKKCVAFPLTQVEGFDRNHILDFFKKIKMHVCLLHKEKKKIGSTDGMILSALTSENIVKRVEIVKNNLLSLVQSIKEHNVDEFLSIVMKDSNNFHSVCMDTYPPLFYLSDRSKDVVSFIHDFNKKANRTVVGYTFDAGPNPFILVSADVENDFIKGFKERFEIMDDDLISLKTMI